MIQIQQDPDFIFRCQIFDEQVKKITTLNGEEIVIFHKGLQRTDHNLLMQNWIKIL